MADYLASLFATKGLNDHPTRKSRRQSAASGDLAAVATHAPWWE
jgi:hypothetical protein